MSLRPLEAWQFQVGYWAEQTFPKSTEATILAHLRDEVNNELCEGCDGEELADVAMLLFHLAYKRGLNLSDEISRKFAINCRRKCQTEPNEKGFMSHVDDAR